MTNPFSTKSPLRGPKDLLRAGLARWSEDRRRQLEMHQLKALADLDDRILRDIGQTRDEIDHQLRRLRRRA